MFLCCHSFNSYTQDYLQSLDEIITELKKDIITKDSVINNLQGTVHELEERLSETEKNAALTSKRLGTQ